MATTKLVIDCATQEVREVTLTAAEIADRDARDTAGAAFLTSESGDATDQLRAKRDRYLAETDWIALPAASRPVDMPADVAKAIDANLPAWQTFRQALRDYMVSVVDPFNPPAFPVQPSSPKIILT